MKRRTNGFGTRFRQIGTGLAGVVLVSALAAACSSSSSSTTCLLYTSDAADE